MKQPTIDRIIDQLEKLGPFLPEQRRQLAELIEERSYKPREIIKGVSNFNSYAFFLSKGSLRLFFTERGREMTAGFTMADEFVIVPRKLVVAYPDTLAIEFMEPSTIVFLPQLQVKDLIAKKCNQVRNEAMIFLNAALIQYTSLLESRIHLLSMPSKERVQWFEQTSPRIFECATLSQIASYLGIAKETMYRIRNGKYI